MVNDRTGTAIVAGDDVFLAGEIVAFDGNTAIVRCGERTFRVHAADTAKLPVGKVVDAADVEGGGGGVTDHGALTGLDDPADHPWALLADGSRQMSGGLDMDGHDILNPGTVDGVDVSAHDHGGAGQGGVIDHANLNNIGTNDHATIDTHIAATAAHGATGAVVGTTNTQSLSNKALDGTCDLGALAGAKGQVFPFQCSADDMGTGLVAVASFIDGQHMELPTFTAPVNCKVVGISGNVEHDNGSDPGDWRVVIQNLDGGTVVRNNCTMDNVGLTPNPFAGGLSAELALSQNHRFRVYMDGPACDHVRFRLWLFFATT